MFCFRSEEVIVIDDGNEDSGESIVPCMIGDSNSVSGDGDTDSSDNIMPGVCDHASAKAAAVDGKQAEKHAVSDDGDHAADAFVSVGCSEK